MEIKQKQAFFLGTYLNRMPYLSLSKNIKVFDFQNQNFSRAVHMEVNGPG